jgi:hypothetical protein
MAQIPVQRKNQRAAVPATKTGGMPRWLLPAIALLLLIPLLLLSMRGCSDTNNAGIAGGNAANRSSTDSRSATALNENATNNTAVVVANSGASEEPSPESNNNQTAGSANVESPGSGAVVTDASYFAGINDKSALAGRRAELKSVRVRRVLSDHLFTVGSGRGEIYAFLGENLDSGGGREDKIRIRRGQVLDLSGDFRPIPEAEVQDETQNGGLSEKELKRLKGQKIYLHASGVGEAGK